MQIKNTSIIYLLAVIFLLDSCKKDEFLDKKPSTDIVVPTKLSDLKTLMDNDAIFNPVTPSLFYSSADDITISDLNWTNLQYLPERNAYIWSGDLFGGTIQIADWNYPFRAIFYANVALSQLSKLSDDQQITVDGKYVKGAASLFRAFSNFQLLEAFSTAYDVNTADADMGIPLRLNPSVDEILQRSSVQQGFDLVLSDLRLASSMLSSTVNTANPNRPTKPAALALLARVNLYMRNYIQAGIYADSCLKIYNKLIDYNTIDPTTTTPFARTNDEALLYSTSNNSFNYAIPYYIGAASYGNANTALYNLYDTNDLRKSLFYLTSANTTVLKRGYSAQLFSTSSLATDEMYLIRAECYARAGNVSASMNDLNTLLKLRFKNGTFVPYVASDAANALQQILIERRKELVGRGLRWPDLKRLNKEGANITLTHVINGTTYTLLPNDPRYVFPIPDDEIALSGIPQNLR